MIKAIKALVDKYGAYNVMCFDKVTMYQVPFTHYICIQLEHVKHYYNIDNGNIDEKGIVTNE